MVEEPHAQMPLLIGAATSTLQLLPTVEATASVRWKERKGEPRVPSATRMYSSDGSEAPNNRPSAAVRRRLEKQKVTYALSFSPDVCT